MDAPRLFVPAAMAEGDLLLLGAEQAHKVLHVLRMRAGDRLRLFNGRDGEFAAAFEMQGKAAAARIFASLRAQTALPDLRLLFAPLKRQANDWMVEKATELGVAALQPVLTRRCVAERVREERLRLIAQSSAEQCERLDLPMVQEAQSLEGALAHWPAGAPLLFADEAGDAPPVLQALAGCAPGPVLGLLIGPEGGFAPEERDRLRALPWVIAISLGPRILRAETAAIAGLALIQAGWGDWQRPLC